MTTDLFGEPIIAGLQYRPNFITRDEEHELIGHLSASDPSTAAGSCTPQ